MAAGTTKITAGAIIRAAEEARKSQAQRLKALLDQAAEAPSTTEDRDKEWKKLVQASCPPK